MKEIKTRAAANTPKILKTAVRLPRKTKDNLLKARDKLKETQTHNQGEQPEQYATDQTTRGASTVVQKGSRVIRTLVNRLARRGKQAWKQKVEDRSGQAETSHSSNPSGKEYSAKHTPTQSTISTPSDKPYGTGRTPVIRNAGQSGYHPAETLHNTVVSGRKGAAHTVKTASKSMKTPQRVVKASARSIKTGAKTVKTTARTARTAARASVQAARAARATAKAIATGIKLMVKATIASVKAIIAATKALISAIAAGGWVVVVIIIIIAAIVFLLSSPFGIFVNGGADGTPTISEAVQELNSEFDAKVENIKRTAGQVDQVRLAFVGDDERSSIDNWPDILAVFAVIASLDAENPMDVVTMDNQRISMLRDVFWKMVTIRHTITEKIPVSTPQATVTPASLFTSTPTPAPIRILNITVAARYWDDTLTDFNYTEQQLQILESLTSSKYYTMLASLANTVSGSPATDWSGVIDIPEGGMPIPLYLQGDYTQTVCYIDGEAKSVKTSGCGAASMSMVISYLTGNTSQNPYTLFKWAYDNGYYDGNGLSHTCLTKLAQLYGVEGTWIANDEEQIAEALRAGYPVIAHMGPGIFTTGGHYIVLRGITEDGHVLVNDPGNRNRNKYAYPMSTVVRQARTSKSFMICENDS